MSRATVQFIGLVGLSQRPPRIVPLESGDELPKGLWYFRGDDEAPDATCARLLRLYGVATDVVYVVGLENWCPVCPQSEPLPRRLR